ncbi:MAG: HpcH/HpaI aldolase/citrate lyase family protein [Paracoccaceae bacterium]
MIKIPNPMRDKLDRGELALGVGLRGARTVEIARAMKTAGFDWLFIDMEHNTMSLDDACNISVAGQAEGITPVVRVPGVEHHHATRALDGGAQGIIVPHVDDLETAKQMVANTRYPPMGHRSLYGALPQAGFEAHPVPELMEALNTSTYLVLMIESPEGVANADAIAALPGVDALLIGTADLTAEMGIPGEVEHPDVVAAYETVIAACQKHGKHAGMGGVYAPDAMKRYIDMGMRLILAGSEFAFMMQGARAQTTAVRALL